jgi:thymidine kinase
MIRIVAGPPGSGKTKRMIDLANEAVRNSKGDIVFIDGDNRHMTKISHHIRLINAKEFDLHNPDAFYGFLCGIVAQNFDTEQVFVDGLFYLAQATFENGEALLNRIKDLSERHNVRFVVSIRGDEGQLPDYIKHYLI